jgi:HK97 gp10 family phage protein
MPSFKVKVVWDDGAKIIAAMTKKQRHVVRAVDAGALMVQGEAQTSILRGPKTGRVYPLPGGKTHQASAPGEPPASNTGNLASSIQPNYRIDTERTKQTDVVARANYAGFLEEGTSRMDARPFLAKALQKMRKKILAFIRKAVQA